MATPGRVKRPEPAFDAKHPIAVGATVTIIKISHSTGPFIEGCAVIKGVARGPHSYWVEFPGDPAVKRRVVFYNYQNDPRRLLEMLEAIWRASDVPVSGEFFPPKIADRKEQRRGQASQTSTLKRTFL
jgi:hypothetical protein